MQQSEKDTGLIWFRNNLRTRDNISLYKACKNHEKVIGVFCFDPKLFEKNLYGFHKTDKFRAQFLIETVTNLQKELARLNITLLVFHQNIENTFDQIINQFDIHSIYTQKEWTSEEVEKNRIIKSVLPSDINWVEDYDQFLYHPDTVSRNFINIPNIFTAFRKKLEKYVEVREEVITKDKHASNLLSETSKIPQITELGFSAFEAPKYTEFPFKGGEDDALNRLNYYLFESKKVSYYKQTRNGLIGNDYSTKLSPWLANGSISAKTIYWSIKKYEKEVQKNQSTYWIVFELIWRDFFKYISLKYGNRIFNIGGILDRKYDWNQNSEQVNQWIEGKTDDDFVNANMIELKETGWMSNRGRQNVASYFAKELLLDWRIGAAYFESQLLDYDVHSNYGNWMYVAGVGNDPRDRKFNTKLQADRYDSNGKYRKLWLTQTLF